MIVSSSMMHWSLVTTTWYVDTHDMISLWKVIFTKRDFATWHRGQDIIYEYMILIYLESCLTKWLWYCFKLHVCGRNWCEKGCGNAKNHTRFYDQFTSNYVVSDWVLRCVNCEHLQLEGQGDKPTVTLVYPTFQDLIYNLQLTINFS